jgi:cytochrome c oxidase subunit II
VPRWIQQEHLPAAAVPGAKLFATAGCTSCHTYAGSGTSALHAPDLTSIGSRHLAVAFLTQQLGCPECVNPGSPMPRFDSLGTRHLRQLAIFLEASKGRAH